MTFILRSAKIPSVTVYSKMEFLLQDENYQFLRESIPTMNNQNSTQIVTMMTRFRRNLCFSWISKIVAQKTYEISACIEDIIRTILQFTVHSDATVRVTAYSTLGGLLVSITPFAASRFPIAFGHAIRNIDVTPKLSIAIINMFMYLTRFVSPVFIEKYITEVPVSFHFGVDVSEFIQYIPQTIPLMKDLPLELLRNILRSIICSCGRKPNAAFTSTVVSLVMFNVKPQMEVVMNYIQANNLDAAAVWLGPPLLKDRNIYDQLSDDNRNMFFNYAVKEFNRQPLNLTQFEHACKTCALFFRYTKGTPVYDNIERAVMSALRNDYPLVYRIRMLFLPTPLEELQDNRSDSDSVRSARLNALATHFEDNLDTANADQIAEMFVSYQDSDNDLYCTFVDAFSRCIAEMLARCKNRTHIELLEFILKKKNKNWVHDEAVAHLIDSIPTSLCLSVFPNYTNLALNKLLEFELSSNDRLVDTSIKSIEKFSSIDNIQDILMRIIWSDWHNESVVSRRFLLLSKLVKIFNKIQNNEKLFSMFIEIGYECLFLYENTTTLSFIFAFLSKMTIPDVPQKVIDFSLEFIVYHYEVYTHKELDKVGISIPVPDKYFLDTLDTDIVTNPTINHHDALIHLKNCFAFLLKNKPKQENNLKSLFIISIILIPIFDSFALKGASKLSASNSEYTEMMGKLINETFVASSNEEVAITCCQCFVKGRNQIFEDSMQHVIGYLSEEKTYNPDLLFLCYVLTDQVDHDKAMNFLPLMIKRLPPKEATVLLFKLTNVVSKIAMNQFPEEYSIALLEYANNWGGEYRTKVQNYIDTTPFSEWPLDDEEMNACLLKFLGNTKIDITYDQMCHFDQTQLKFIVSNISLFDEQIVRQFIQNNRDKFAKIDISKIAPNPEPIFSFALNNSHKSATKLSSAAPFIENNIFVHSLSLSKYYFKFTKKKISEELFLRYVKSFLEARDEDGLASILEFGLRNGINVQNLDFYNTILNDEIFFGQKIFQYECRQLAKLGSISKLNPSIVEKIENAINQKLEPNVILSTHPDLPFLVRIEPSYFLDYVLTREVYKAHDFIPLSKLITKIYFDPQKLTSLALKYIPQYNDFTSIRKKTVFLRYLSSAIFCLTAQRKKEEIKSIVDAFGKIFEGVISRPFSTLYKELSIFFGLIVKTEVSMSPFNNFFSSLKGKDQIYILFVKQAAYLQSKRNEPQVCLSTTNIRQLSKYFLPSERTASLAAIQYFAPNVSTVEFYSYLRPFLSSLETDFTFLAKNFLTGPSLGTFISTLLGTPPAELISNDFFINFSQAFLGDSSTPIFYYTLPISSGLFAKSPSIFNLLLTARVGSPYLIKEIDRIYTETRKMKNSQARELFDVQTYELYLPLFMRYPTISSGKLLYKIGKNSSVPASFFYVKLVLDTPNFLPLYVFLKDLFKSMDDKLKKQVQTVISATTYQNRSRSLAMKSILSNLKQNNVDFFIASAETDDVDSIKKEYTDTLNGINPEPPANDTSNTVDLIEF